MKNTPTAEQSTWARELATFDAGLRARGMAEKTRRAYGLDLQQLAAWARRGRAMFELAYAAGRRAEEVVNLDVTDVDPDGEELRVSGKGGRTRIVPAGEPAWRAIDAYLERARPRLAAAEGGGPGGRAEA